MNFLHLNLPTAAAPCEPESRVTARAESHASTEEDIRRVFGNDREAAAQRLQELDEEWSIESLFEGSAAIVGLTTFVLGLTVDDRWLVLPLVVSLLLLQQTIQGWCPLLPFMRGLGFRTEREIHFERHVLQQLEEDHAECHFPGHVLAGAAVRTQRHHMVAAVPTACAASFSLRNFLLETAQ